MIAPNKKKKKQNEQRWTTGHIKGSAKETVPRGATERATQTSQMSEVRHSEIIEQLIKRAKRKKNYRKIVRSGGTNIRCIKGHKSSRGSIIKPTTENHSTCVYLW